MLGQYLESEGYRVSLAEGGTDMRRFMADSHVALVLLDHMIPGEDGLSLLRSIRADSRVPVIMVTGKREMLDRVVGLEVGADDYIAKPFHLREVLARIRAVLRRCQAEPLVPELPSTDSDEGERYGFAGWVFDPVRRELRDPKGTEVRLTTSEFDLLAAFLRAPNRPLDRDQLMDLARGRDWTPLDRSIDTLVGRLRKKVEADPQEPELIKTVRGVGYVFTPRVQRF